MRFFFLAVLLSFCLPSCAPTYVLEEPPRDIEEVIPVRPRADMIWIQGHHIWRRGQWIWVSGHWKKTRPGRIWVGGHWKKAPRGWIWVEGHWARRAR